MTYELVVVEAFGAYARGTVVTDPGQVASILGSEQRLRVVRVAMMQKGS